jgi:uncharacterized protein YjeT (DUF2065 family)
VAESLLLAAGLVLVIEGLMPLVAPASWRATMLRIAQLRDGQLRFIGMASILVGLLLISV